MAEPAHSPRGGRSSARSVTLPSGEDVSLLTLEEYLSQRQLTPDEYGRLLQHMRETGASFRPAPAHYPFVNPLLLQHLSDVGVDVSQTSIKAMGLPEWAEVALSRGQINTVHELASASTFLVRTVLGFSGRPYGLLRQRTEQYLISLIEAADSGSKDAEASGRVEDLALSPRTIRALRRAGIFTISQLARMAPEELSRLKGVGPKGALELQTVLPTGPKHPSAELGAGIEAISLRPAVARRPLTQTDIPAGLLARLEAAGIRTVGQLVGSLPELSSVPRIGPVSSRRIRASLEAYLLSALERVSPEVEPEAGSEVARTESLEQQVRALVLTAGSDRAFRLLIRRFGIDTRVHTLEEIGREIGVTRERARQLERAALARIRGDHKQELEGLTSPLRRLLSAAGGVAPLTHLTRQLPHTYNLGSLDPGAALRFLLLMSETWTQMPGRRIALRGAPIDAVDRLDEALTTLLRRHMSPMTVEQVTAALATSPEYATVLKLYPTFSVAARAAANPATFLLPGGEVALQGWRRSRVDNAVAALRTLGQPAHFSAIAKMVQESADASTSPAQVSTQAVHNLLLTEPVFVRTGRGTFGLWEWYERDASVRRLLIEQMQAENRAAHVDELAAATGLDVRAVARTLISEPEFVPLGRDMYRLRASARVMSESTQSAALARRVVAEVGVAPGGASFVRVRITRSTYRSGTLALNTRIRPLFPVEGNVRAVWHGPRAGGSHKLHRGRSHISGLSGFISARKLRPGDTLYIVLDPAEPESYHLYTEADWQHLLGGSAHVEQSQANPEQA